MTSMGGDEMRTLFMVSVMLWLALATAASFFAAVPH
jgi:hypothetical protein